MKVQKCRIMLHRALPSVTGMLNDQRILREGHAGPGVCEYTITDARAQDGTPMVVIVPSTSVAFVIPT